MELETLITTLTKRRPALRPQEVWKPELISQIENLRQAPLYVAGLHLWNDDLDRCHHLVQERETPTGNYWHAILHRREGDYSNSLYWYRRIGDHAVLQAMAQKFPGWSAATFVKNCEKDETSDPTLQEQQACEMRLLLDYSLGDGN